MLWGSIDLKKYICATCPFGGPIALILNEKRIVSYQGFSAKPILQIYSSSGKLLNQIQWERGNMVTMGWTCDEKLVCVFEQGYICIVDITGSITQISLGEDAKEYGIMDAVIRSNELVVLTNHYRFICIHNLNEPRPKQMADLGLTMKPFSWDIMPSDQGTSGYLEVFCATKNTIYIVDQANAVDQRMLGEFQKMSISPNGKFIALFTSDARLLVVSTDFQESLADLQTNSDSPPIQMAWCGNDAVVLHWEDTLLIVGPSAHHLKFPYDGIILLQQEIDSLRVISSDSCEIISRVSDISDSIFKFGSEAPGAILFDAREQFDKKNSKSEEYIRSIRVTLRKAVDDCIEAAGSEFDIDTQKSLLKAASFGKGFLDNYPLSKLVDMGKSLRILNSIRDPIIGMPLTYAQYKQMTPEKLVYNLCQRHHYGLAKTICMLLTIPIDRVLIHWACYKVRSSAEEEEVLTRAIFDKLSDTSGISYSEVAKEAYNAGKIKLATNLLGFEVSPSDQVPLLLSMQQDELALNKSIESGDTDLVYLCLFHMKRKLTPPEFFRIVNSKPLACALLEVYAKQQDVILLRDFYYQDDRRVASANLILQSSYKEKEFENRLVEIKAAFKIFNEQKTTYNEAKTTDEMIKLLQVQNSFEKELGHCFDNLSLVESVLKCYQLGHTSKVTKLKHDFKISDKKMAMFEFRSLVDSQNWEAMQLFLKTNPKFNYKFGLNYLMKAGYQSQSYRFVEAYQPGTLAQREAKAYQEEWLGSIRGKTTEQTQESL